MQTYRVVIVDDELSNLESLERILRSDGGIVQTFQDPRDAVPYVKNSSVDVLITDLRMHSMSGMELLEATKQIDPSVQVIMVTAYGTVELAVEAMKKKAYDFITKPLRRVSVLRTVHKALDKKNLISENLSLKEELNTHLEGRERFIIGKSHGLRLMMEIADQAARSKANILIDGESGTGKGVLAEYLHRHSEWASGIFCESELHCHS